MSERAERSGSRTDAPKREVMSTDEWMRMHLRRAPERDQEWVRRVLILHGKA